MQWIMGSWTSRRMVIHTCLQTFMTCFSIRILSFTQTFSGSICLPFLPALYFPVFSCYRISSQTHLSHSTPVSFIVLLFQYCCFQLIFPMVTAALASQNSQQVWASEKQPWLLPMCAILITSVACTSTDGTCWSINKCLPYCSKL